MMNVIVAHKVGAWILEHRPKTVDITGGAPEISELKFCIAEAYHQNYEELTPNDRCVQGVSVPRLKKVPSKVS